MPLFCRQARPGLRDGLGPLRRMPIAMYRCLIRKVNARTFAAYCQGQPLKGWWAARHRLERLCK